MRASVYTCTRLGGDHDANQDRALVGAEVLAGTRGVERAEVNSPTVLGVFDGLGGHAAGDVASELAARSVAAAEIPADEPSVTALLQRADDLLVEAMRRQPERAGMGTTVALLVLLEDGAPALTANVGDSTIYRLRERDVEELSISDRWQGSGVLQCLGANEDGVEPHIRSVALAPGDRILIATDGLTDVVPPEVLVSVLEGDLIAGSESLLDMVEQAGVPDDLTFVVAELDG